MTEIVIDGRVGTVYRATSPAVPDTRCTRCGREFIVVDYVVITRHGDGTTAALECHKHHDLLNDPYA